MRNADESAAIAFEQFRGRLLRDGWAPPDEALWLRDTVEKQKRALREAAAHYQDGERLRSALEAERDRLRTALEESVALQSHYAALLNCHDGGRRRTFTYADWIERVVEIQAGAGAAGTTSWGPQ